MPNEIKDKIMFEYDIFYLDCMHQSKPGIFARSGEIELKKRLKTLLLEMVADRPDRYARLLLLSNVLEESYCYVMDRNTGGEDEEGLVRAWVESIGVNACAVQCR